MEITLNMKTKIRKIFLKEKRNKDGQILAEKFTSKAEFQPGKLQAGWNFRRRRAPGRAAPLKRLIVILVTILVMLCNFVAEFLV